MPAVSPIFFHPPANILLNRSRTSLLAITATNANRNISVRNTCVGFRVRDVAIELVRLERMRKILESRLLLPFVFVLFLLAPWAAGLRVGAVGSFRVLGCGKDGVGEGRERADVVEGGGAEGVGERVRWELDAEGGLAVAVGVDSDCSLSCCCLFWICDLRNSSSMP